MTDTTDNLFDIALVARPASAEDEPAPTLYMGTLPKSQDDASPDRKFIRGLCPDCGGLVVSNTYEHSSGTMSFVHECWESIKPTPTCSYFTIP